MALKGDGEMDFSRAAGFVIDRGNGRSLYVCINPDKLPPIGGERHLDILARKERFEDDMLHGRMGFAVTPQGVTERSALRGGLTQKKKVSKVRYKGGPSGTIDING